MRLLDLFCGAGLASDGYSRWFDDIVGVDIHNQYRFPYEFVKADALTFPLHGFDAIHASPPCQAYSDLQKRNNRNTRPYPDLISEIRTRLQEANVPYVIENVETAPLHNPVMLCGTMFPKLRVIRHRHFECNFPVISPPHSYPHPRCYTTGRRYSQYGLLDEWKDYVQVTGGGNCSVEAARDAMGVTRWVSKVELNEAIPPAYTTWIGGFLRQAVRTKGGNFGDQVRLSGAQDR
jgi:DNA (cytosine-5)-methyltransferase 1